MARHMMNPREAGVYIGGKSNPVSYWTMLDKAKKGLIPCVRVGSRVLFSQEGLDSWIEEQEALSIKVPEKQYGKLRKIY